MKIDLYNENCLDTMKRMKRNGDKVNIILTSPPYNIRRNVKTERAKNNFECFYDSYKDNMTDDDYCNFIKNCFDNFDSILSDNGVVLWNCNYGNENFNQPWLSLSYILILTNFCISEVIYWRKKCAIPNNVSRNKLTRIIEPIFVLVKKENFKSYQCNKKVVSVNDKTKQNFYENIVNFIEAANNDGACKLNKATFSSEMVSKLLDIYAMDGDVVYDPFMGTGTTAVGCVKFNGKISRVIGSEISSAQVEYSKQRLGI